MSEKASTRYKGRNKYVPDDTARRSVSMMVAVGIQQAEICRVLEITIPTLLKHFRRELDSGLVRANANIGARLYAKAEKGDTVSMIFWLKARAGWTETVKVDGDLGFSKLIEVLERRRKKVHG